MIDLVARPMGVDDRSTLRASVEPAQDPVAGVGRQRSMAISLDEGMPRYRYELT